MQTINSRDSIVNFSGYSMSNIMDDNYNIEIVMNKEHYYCSQSVMEQIKKDAGRCKLKLPTGSDPFMLGHKVVTIIKLIPQIDFRKTTTPFIMNECQIENKHAEQVSDAIFKRYFEDNKNSKSCSPGIYFKYTGKKLVFSKLLGNEKDGFLAYMDQTQKNLYVRPSEIVAKGAVKNFYNISFLELANGKIHKNQSTTICMSTKVELGERETTLLERFSCEQIISAPQFLAKIQWPEGSYPTHTFEYLADRATGSLNTSFIRKYQPTNLGILNLLWDTAKGLDFLHGNNLVHFDLKGPNILFYDLDSQITCKVADFGSCQSPFKDSNRGVPEWTTYGAPECLSIGPDNRTDYSFPYDMWSLGVTLFTLGAPLREPKDSSGEFKEEMPYFHTKLEEFFSLPENELFNSRTQQVHSSKLLEQIKMWPEKPANEMIHKTILNLLSLNPSQRPTAGHLNSEIKNFLESCKKES